LNPLIPRWLIGARTLSGGRRLAKKPSLPVMGYGMNSLPAIYRRKEGGIVQRFVNAVTGSTQFKDLKDFDKSEFRFWMPDTYKEHVLTASCRYCGSIMTSPRLRTEHHQTHGCTKGLVAAYKLLGRDRKCVVCDTDCRAEKWGVPLCSDTCINKWCYDVAQPVALQLAIDLVARDTTG
jgi:hypothetical protein